jgi:hypothetical protein
LTTPSMSMALNTYIKASISLFYIARAFYGPPQPYP